MSRPISPTVAERRQAALSGTPGVVVEVRPPVYVLRLGGASDAWLKREAPSVTWGPQQQAMTFKTMGEARRAVSRLDKHGALTIEEIAA